MGHLSLPDVGVSASCAARGAELAEGHRWSRGASGRLGANMFFQNRAFAVATAYAIRSLNVSRGIGSAQDSVLVHEVESLLHVV